MVGEASISLATACYGSGINGNSGHEANDVLYVAFTGDDAVPGKNGANWNASSFDEFQSSIMDLGNKLVERIGSGRSGGGGGGSGGGGGDSGSGCDGRVYSGKWAVAIALFVGCALVAF